MVQPDSRGKGQSRLDTEFDALLEAVVDAIVVIDDQGTIVEFSPGAQRMFGYAREATIGRDVGMLMPEAERAAHPAHLARYLDTGEARIIGIGREVEALKSDGEKFPAWLSVGEAVHEGRRRFVGIVRDLTDVRAAEHRRHALEAQLAHLDRFSLLGEMAAGVAHEINQPLAAIANYAQASRRLLAVESPDRSVLTEACTGIAEQAQRASRVIENLRTLIRKQEVRKETLALNDVVEDVMPLILADAKAAGVRVETDLAEDLPSVEGNGIQLQQVLINLTHNAVDAMSGDLPRRGVVRIGTRKLEEGGAELSIKDNGPGVSPRLRGVIFHPFVTTKRAGLGVGLAISRTIARNHSGDLTYADAPDGGAIFTVTLPGLREESK
jgi:two-component system sensor kinase FixL